MREPRVVGGGTRRFSVEEVVHLTVEFYRRNYIEGLFLSSGIIRSPDDTMADMVRIARTLREQQDFRGYIHLKTIPEAAPELIEQAGRWADRLSVNIELPTAKTLSTLAPEKSAKGIRKTMAEVRLRREASREKTYRGRARTRFAPAGQSTQMIVGADGATDRTILHSATSLYANYALSRVYYSAFSPIPDASAALPLIRPPLMREHRLYQADWLLRFYGFRADEIATGGMLDLDLNPKLAWAIENRHAFPVDVNRAPREIAAPRPRLRHAHGRAHPLRPPPRHRALRDTRRDGRGPEARPPVHHRLGLVTRDTARRRRSPCPLRATTPAIAAPLMRIPVAAFVPCPAIRAPQLHLPRNIPGVVVGPRHWTGAPKTAGQRPRMAPARRHAVRRRETSTAAP